MGALPLSGIALRFFVDELEPLSDESIQLALGRCRREIGGNGYAPTLTIKDVLDRAGVIAQDRLDDAECRAAWDALLRYASKHIVSDVEGSYVPRHYFGVDTQVPKLDQRTADALRRIGGWAVIKTITADDYPFVQKRFYEEYRAWSATDAALLRGALNGNQTFAALLEAKEMRPSRSLPELREQARQLQSSGPSKPHFENARHIIGCEQ